jgi:hypothetical protein
LGQAFERHYKKKMNDIGPGLHKIGDDWIQVFYFRENEKIIYDFVTDTEIIHFPKCYDSTRSNYAELWNKRLVYIPT